MKFMNEVSCRNIAIHQNKMNSAYVDNKQNISIKKNRKTSFNQPIEKKLQQNIQKVLQQKSKEQCLLALEPYKQNILEHLMSLPKHGPFPLSNYFSSQQDITQQMRAVLLNWLIDVQLKYKLSNQTFAITVNIIDQYLSIRNISRSNLQLLGIAALWIAAKYSQTYQVPKLSNLVYICDSAFTQKQILTMEQQILLNCQFNILQPCALTYFDIINSDVYLNQKEYHLGCYILEIVLLQIQMRKYPPSLIAFSTFYLICKLIQQTQISQYQKQNSIKIKIYSLLQKLQINKKQMKTCANQICFLWQKAYSSNNQNSLKSKYSIQSYSFAGKLTINNFTSVLSQENYQNKQNIIKMEVE